MGRPDTVCSIPLDFSGPRPLLHYKVEPCPKMALHLSACPTYARNTSHHASLSRTSHKSLLRALGQLVKITQMWNGMSEMGAGPARPGRCRSLGGCSSRRWQEALQMLHALHCPVKRNFSILSAKVRWLNNSGEKAAPTPCCLCVSIVM